jgi:peptidyl-tRNA hydrolase, PTH1 family
MLLLVGLGNPGHQYAWTRHNVGYWTIDGLAKALRIPLKNLKHQALVGSGAYQGTGVVLAKPLTFMNRSGVAVAGLAGLFKVLPGNILVIHDDLDLPLGKLRLRAKGGSGGHNGIKSLIEHLKSEDFNRLRIGIGRPLPVPSENPAADHVLAPFSPAEEEIMAVALPRAVEAALHYVRSGILDAMNHYN